MGTFGKSPALTARGCVNARGTLEVKCPFSKAVSKLGDGK